MLFLSIGFVVLFVLCFVLYYIIPDKFRNLLLLAASCVFIGYANWLFLLIAVVISTFTYFAAIQIERANEKRTVHLFWGSVAALIATWISFRYATSLIFPLGISFYSFQAIGYLTDVYWKETKAERSFVNLSLFMLFFMKFLSGPIERAEDMFAELKRTKHFDYDKTVLGLKLIALGLLKKLLIANHLAPITADIFNSFHELSGIQLLVTFLLYPIELYADFSGYTDIAIGGALMFGLNLSPNFNRPFIATSTADLWRRWHISLSSWVRDYMYAPLTAQLRGLRQNGILLSLVVTFVALGVWHGVGWSFAVYGLIQGLIICYEMKFKVIRNTLYKYLWKPLADTVFIVRTYLLFAISLIFFKLESLSDAVYYLTHISFGTHGNWKEVNIGMSDHSWVVVVLSTLVVLIFEQLNESFDLNKWFKKLPTVVRWVFYFVLIFTIFLLGKFDTEEFIYIQF